MGTIVSGAMLRGSLKEGDRLMIGPGHQGQFAEIKVMSIHRNRLPCRMVAAGQTACISVGKFEEFIVRRVSLMFLMISENVRAHVAVPETYKILPES